MACKRSTVQGTHWRVLLPPVGHGGTNNVPGPLFATPLRRLQGRRGLKRVRLHYHWDLLPDSVAVEGAVEEAVRSTAAELGEGGGAG